MTPMPDVEALVRIVETDASSDDPLEQLAQAARSAMELEELTDALLGHFVEACRASGCSWTEISSVLGVTRQAAHKRFAGTTPTFERFTPRARTVLADAVEQARSRGDSWVGTEHLLMSLIESTESLAGQVLLESDVTRDAVETYLRNERGEPASADKDADARTVRREIGYSPRARSALRAALDEALKLGHNYIGTEHLLLGLYEDRAALGGKILESSGLTRDTARRLVVAKLQAMVQGRKNPS